MTDVRLLAIVGSLRRTSINAVTARAAGELLPDGTRMTFFDPHPVPFYNGDIEQAGLPDPVADLQKLAADCHGIIFFSPEYNGSFPAVTKNIIDWLTRPPKSWQNKAVTMVVSTPGGRAGKGVRDHFESIMAFQPIRLFPTLGIAHYQSKLDQMGRLADEQTLGRLGDHLADFARFATEVAEVNES